MRDPSALGPPGLDAAPLRERLAKLTVETALLQHDLRNMLTPALAWCMDQATSRKWAARRLVRMWEKNGAAAFSDLSASLVNNPRIAVAK